MTEKRIQFNDIVQEQLPSYVKEEYPLIGEFLKQYYISQEFLGSPTDLIQNIDQYIKLDNIKEKSDSAILSSDISFFDETIVVSNETGTSGFPNSYGLLQIDNEIITYTNKTQDSFLGCIRGFSAVTSYNDENVPDQLVFSTSSAEEHVSGATILNLSGLFLNQFFNKIKYQLSPGFEDREFYSELDKYLFLKQSKDFYSTRGTDLSFKILFKALYGQDVKIIKPQDYLIKPSDAQYRVTNDLVVESLSGNPEDLLNSTLFQDDYPEINISSGYAPISNIEKIFTVSNKSFYKISFDSGYNRDIAVDGTLYGNFSIHPKTRVIGNVSLNEIEFNPQIPINIDVDSTVGFPNSGQLLVTYSDGTEGLVTYQSKNLNQFIGCENIIKSIDDNSEIFLNVFAYGTSNKNPNEIIRVRVGAVLNDIEILGKTKYQIKDSKSIIKSLGVNSLNNVASNNWIFNVSNKIDISSISVINTLDDTYLMTSLFDHGLKEGDSILILSSDGTENSSNVVNVISRTRFEVRGQGSLNTNLKYTVKRNLLKVNYPNYPEVLSQISDVQNTYVHGQKTLVSSPSLPNYVNQPLNATNRSVVFSGTFVGDTFQISNTEDHGFYTGDSVYYFSDIGSLVENGVYFITRVDSLRIKLSRSRSNVYKSNFINLEESVEVQNSSLTPTNLYDKLVTPQNILREISPPLDDEKQYPTEPGPIGILINGTEILNYKSKDTIFYGGIENIDVISGGTDYDVINPPQLVIRDSVGFGATGFCSVNGTLQEIKIVDSGFDYIEVPKIKITGGNGSGAKAKAVMQLVDHESSFNSESQSQFINLTNNTIGFSTYHKFRNFEKIIYKTDSQKGVGGLSTDSQYYVSVKDLYTVSLHQTFQDSVSGINTVSLTSYGIGNHSLQSYNKKSVISSINIEQSGSNYENKKRTCSSLGISTSSNDILIKNHDFKSGEIVVYSTDGTVIGGLSNNTEYYVTKVNDDIFRLSKVGISTSDKDFYYNTRQYIQFTSQGSGTHFFNYPQITVDVIGSVGISSDGSTLFKAILQPIFRGQITSIHLQESGSGYGSNEIINYDRQPEVIFDSGSGAELIPIVNNGRIVEVVVNNAGLSYSSPPRLDVITGGIGLGAVLTPVLDNGRITSVKIVSGGINYDPKDTFIKVSSSGFGAVVYSKIKSWTINLVNRHFSKIKSDDGFINDNVNSKYGLQYFNLYAPRVLRESIFSVDSEGRKIYGKPDLIKVSGKEVSSTRHSPIIGWAYDGNPIYGPYGYASKYGGIISKMKSGYVLNPDPNRPSLPIGYLVEDYQYQSVDDETVLDEFNGRFCVTPDFPQGVYAYFATIDEDYSSSFNGYRLPSFPYFIGNSFKSSPNSFNFDRNSNQTDFNLNETKWSRNIYPYIFNNKTYNYDYVQYPNSLNQLIRTKYVLPGSIESVGIITGGTGYKVNDRVNFDDRDSRGFGFSSKVSRIGGKEVSSVSVATTEVYNLEIYPTNSGKGSFILQSSLPHNIKNKGLIFVSGINTSSSVVRGSYIADVVQNTLSVSTPSGIGSVSSTGIVTYIPVSGSLDIRENDIFIINDEKVKILNVDKESSRIRILREIDGTVGTSHSYSNILYENPRRLIINSGLSTSYSYKVNKEIYFDPSESLGIGTISGVGIGATLYFSNPGAGISQIFIPTKSIYLKNHGLETGDLLTYFSNNGQEITVSYDGIGSTSLQNESNVYVAKITKDLIGISTVRVGLGSTGVYVGISDTTRNSSTMYLVGVGTNSYHSFKTNYDYLSGKISSNIVTVSTSQTHGLTNNDTVFVNVNPGFSTTFSIKYNDYNRKLIVNQRTFTSSDVDTDLSTIRIENHDFVPGQKVIYTSSSPSGGLQNNQIYYVVVYDQNNIRLASTSYDATKSNPDTIDITTTSSGEISPINPPIKVYKNSLVNFDLSDSSLSYLNGSVISPAFDFNLYTDQSFTAIFDKLSTSQNFEVIKDGVIGIDTEAKLSLVVNNAIPRRLYYSLTSLKVNTLPEEKKVSIDDFVEANNQIEVSESEYNGKYQITSTGTTSFTYYIHNNPESSSYISSTSSALIKYETTSLSANGPISKVDILSAGKNYYKLPSFVNVNSASGSGSILEAESDSIGRIEKLNIQDIGYDLPSDYTLRPNLSLPKVLRIEPLKSFESIGISSVGVGYIKPTKLIVIDGLTGELVPEVDLKYSLSSNKVTILKNSYRLNDTTPIIIPTQNSNGVGISTIKYNSTTKDVEVLLSVGYSTSSSFPFSVNDKVLIENVSVGVGSTGKGFNSENYNYQLFTVTSVEPNIGGIGSITYNLNEYLNPGETPGSYDAVNSSGRIVPQKYFPKFDISLKTNDFFNGEEITSEDFQKNHGVVENWDSDNSYLILSTKEDINVGETIVGKSSKTVGVALTIFEEDAFINVAPYSKVVSGWESEVGVLNNNQQRVQDSFYYQNFSYSLKSNVSYDTWQDVVGSLNHTSGFKKFSDYQCEASIEEINDNSLSVGISTSVLDAVVDVDGFVDLNCVYDFDLVRENALKIGNRTFSDEVTFSSRILTDYFESVSNRVLTIDDFSNEFNSNPRPTRFSVVDRFLLSSSRAKKYVSLVKDRRYVGERQILLLTLLHDNSLGYINQYGRVETTKDLGSFDFTVDGSEGLLLFYPNLYAVNNYNVTTLTYNLKESFAGIGSTSIGGIVDVKPNTSFVSSGSTTIAGIAATHTSSKILVEINADNGQYQFDEISIVHDGTNLEFIEYGQLTTQNTLPYSTSGLGTYHAYFSGSDVNVDFIPNVGLAASISSIQVSFANTSYSGIGTFDMRYALIESRSTSIASSTSPSSNVISEYSSSDYSGGYFIVQVSDITNNRHQISEVILVNGVDDVYITEYANLETHSSLGVVGAMLSTNTTQLTLTPLPNIDVEVKVYLNTLIDADEINEISSYNDDTITTQNGQYYGTENDIRRSFNLNHKNFPIFQRSFDGSSANIVDISNNFITIPNHFFVSGEKLTYSSGTGETINSPIGIATMDYGVGIGTTDKMFETLYAIKVDSNKIKLAKSAEDALKTIPVEIDIISVGIGSNHTFTANNQNQKLIVSIDNVIQSPIVSTAKTTRLSTSILSTQDTIFVDDITNIFGGDLLKIDNEIMKVTSVGIGSTNAIGVIRPWMGTDVAGYSTSTQVTKVEGNYNIVDNTINFVSAPYGNVPLSTSTNPPDSRDWIGISTGSSFQGRVFMKSGTPNTTNETYYDNYVFDNISSEFDGVENEFTLTSNKSNIVDISNDNAIILVNEIFQTPGITNNYTLSEVSGITSISFVGTGISQSSDINTSGLPIGGSIVSVGSSGGFGYQPLVSAGATAVVSIAGTISSISIGNSGSGYRATSEYTIISNTSSTISAGSSEILVDNENSLYELLNLLNTGTNCFIGVGTFVGITTTYSVGISSILIGTGSTSQHEIPTGTEVVVKIQNPPIGYVNIGVGQSSVGISTITHVGFATIISGNISTSPIITNPGLGYTYTNPPYVIIDDPLSYSSIPLIYGGSSSGVGTESLVDIVVGQGSSVISFTIKNSGYAYEVGEVLTVPVGGITGIPTNTNASFEPFILTIQKTFTDKFSGWSIGQLQVFDKIDSLFDGTRKIFPLNYQGQLVSILASKGSNINIQDNLLVFVNDILQVPGESYVFTGGSEIEFLESPKVGDICNIIFYRGNGDTDVLFRNILETVKIGDDLTLTYDPSIGQSKNLIEDERLVLDIKSTNLLKTDPYYGPGNTDDPTLLRPVVWCRQTEDRIIDGNEIAKDRMLYEPSIYPVAYIIQSVGVGTTVVYVDNLRPLFNQQNENDVDLDFQKNITFISQDDKVGASATAIVSAGGTISSIVINDGGKGYVDIPSVSFESPVGLGTTQRASGIASISLGSVTDIVVSYGGTGYSQSNPPKILIESPTLSKESVPVINFTGDSGVIVGLGTTTISTIDKVIFDFYIPEDSYLRNSSIVGSAVTLSSLNQNDYFVVYGSNVGLSTDTLYSLDNSGNIIGIASTCVDNIYQVDTATDVSSTVIGIGTTIVRRVVARVSGISTISFGSSISSYFGNFSWGKINLPYRNAENQYSAYTNNGISGISSSTLIIRSSPLKYTNYIV